MSPQVPSIIGPELKQLDHCEEQSRFPEQSLPDAEPAVHRGRQNLPSGAAVPRHSHSPVGRGAKRPARTAHQQHEARLHACAAPHNAELEAAQPALQVRG